MFTPGFVTGSDVRTCLLPGSLPFNLGSPDLFKQCRCGGGVQTPDDDLFVEPCQVDLPTSMAHVPAFTFDKPTYDHLNVSVHF